MVIGDTEGLPEKGTAVMEKLITQDGVVAVGGGYHSSVGVASKDVADARDIPVVYAETWNDTITGDKQKYVFRIAPLSSWASGLIWKFALTVPDLKKVAILTENTDYGIPAAKETTEGLKSGGVDAVTFSVDIGTQDYAGIVQRIKAENPDMIITLATGEAAYNFTQQAADAGIGPQDLPFETGQDALVDPPIGRTCLTATMPSSSGSACPRVSTMIRPRRSPSSTRPRPARVRSRATR